MIPENTPFLETERLILRKFTKSDAEDVLLLYSDKEVNTFLPWFPLKTLAEAAKYIHENIFPHYGRELAYCYAITQKTDARVIGYIHIHSIGDSNDFGYALRKEFWHNGITTEACAAVVGRLREVKFPFITATHDVNYPYSGAVMKKLGMVYRYSYKEKWQPKDIVVTFRMYQLNFNVYSDYTYMEYWHSHENHWVETDT